MNPTADQPTPEEEESQRKEGLAGWPGPLPAEELKGVRSPLEKEISRVVEAETLQWEALQKMSSRLSELSDLLEKYAGNPQLKADIEDVSRENAPSNILNEIENIQNTIEAAKDSIDEHQRELGDMISGLLRYALDVLQERAEKMKIPLQNIKAAIKNDISYGDEHIALQQAYKEYDKFRVQYFNELNQTISLLNDPFTRAAAEPFEKEVLKNLFNALKIPACPEGLFKQYMDQKDKKHISFKDFKGQYERYFGEELQKEYGEIEEEIKAKRQELDEAKAKWENRSDVPEFTEAILREHAYWHNLTPEQRFKELLRMRAFELLKPSAGEKRLSPEFEALFYTEWDSYESDKRREGMN